LERKSHDFLSITAFDERKLAIYGIATTGTYAVTSARPVLTAFGTLQEATDAGSQEDAKWQIEEWPL